MRACALLQQCFDVFTDCVDGTLNLYYRCTLAKPIYVGKLRGPVHLCSITTLVLQTRRPQLDKYNTDLLGMF